jgi:glutathione S-transferase
MFQYPLTGLVTMISLFIFFWMAMRVGKARRAHDIKAPAHDGPEDFLRVIRVYENTHEMLVLYLPALWLCALTISDFWTAIIGIFFPIGRIIYALGYYQAADKRGRGFMIGFMATIALMIGATIGLLHAAYAIYS